MARVFLTREARTHFEDLPPNLQDAVDNALTQLEVDPHAAGKQLLGRLKGIWSARVGSYRILYTIEGSGRSPRVIVRAIRHRAVAYQSKRSR
ncbi:MAG: type II toxin-antitoxin system RelE family toxin [Actinomycetota bacterium]